MRGDRGREKRQNLPKGSLLTLRRFTDSTPEAPADVTVLSNMPWGWDRTNQILDNLVRLGLLSVVQITEELKGGGKNLYAGYVMTPMGRAVL